MKIKLISSVTAASLLLIGCSVKPEIITPKMIEDDAAQTMNFLGKVVKPVTQPITLDEAMERAIHHNLTQKVELLNVALENQKIDIVALEALPDLTGKAGYIKRNNYAASGSVPFDLTTGEPGAFLQDNYSVSQQPESKTSGANFSWNVLDFGLSYVRANQQADRYLIAEEKKRKAMHNIKQEVRDAYYKAVSADALLVKIKPMMKEAREAFMDSKNIKDLKLDSPLKSLTYQRELLEVIRSLHAIETNLIDAKTKLSRLMGLKPGTKFKLAERIHTKYTLPHVEKSLNEMEKIALENRPELQETRYQKRISENEVKAAMLKILPGINFNAGYNYDNSEYLLNNTWNSYGANISWNLFSVFNAPLNHKLAKTQVELAKAQKMALSMAVISQVHMSVLEYKQAVKQYNVAQEYHGIASQIFDIVQSENKLDVNGKLSLIKEKLNFVLSTLRLSSSYAAVQNAYGKINTSIGYDEMAKKAEEAKKLEEEKAEKVAEEVKIAESKKAESKAKKIETKTQSENRAIASQKNKLLITPTQRVWIGVVNLKSTKLSQTTTKEPVAIDASDPILIALGHGKVTIVGEKHRYKYNKPQQLYFLYKEGVLKQLSTDEYIGYNNGHV